jgi:hypothetical protein
MRRYPLTDDLAVEVERWTRPVEAEYATFQTLVDVTRRRLCLLVTVRWGV